MTEGATVAQEALLLTLGGVLLLGLLTSYIGRKTFLPRATLLILFGAVIGGEVLDLIPAAFTDWFDIIADMTLVMVGFLLGGKLTRSSLRDSVGVVLWLSLCAALATLICVAFGLAWLGVPTDVAILLGCIATATAPAAVFDVVSESGGEGRFATVLLSVVALDDVWALVLFAVGVAVVSAGAGQGFEPATLLAAAYDIAGAAVLGVALGFPAAYLTGRLKPGQPVLTEALGLVFLCGGLAMWLGVSYLLAAIVLGAVISNFARHHDYPFHAIEGIESQFMIIFFILAGASLAFDALAGVGIIGLAYILARTTGKLLGARLGGHLAGADRATRHWMGVALLPQAGVAIGMALVASNHFPAYRDVLLPLVIGSTVFFEIVGPLFVRLALRRAGEA
jgi:Kef-type K+ transport system membrane component KefB